MRKFIYIIIAAVVVVLTPAIALAQGDGAPTCLTAIAGSDTALAADTVSEASSDGTVSVTNHVDIVAVAGTRTITTDAVRYINNCGGAMELALVAQAPVGDWSASTAQLFLSTTDAPTSLPTADVDGSWGDQPLTVTGATPTGAASGSVIVAAGSSVQVAFAVTAGPDFDTASMRWSAEARPAAD